MLFIDSFRCYFLITLIVVSQFATKLDILFYMGKQYTEKKHPYVWSKRYGQMT